MSEKLFTIEWLSTIKNCLFRDVNILRYRTLAKSNSSDHIEAISLFVEGIQSGQIKCGIDGSSICWTKEPLTPVSMGDFGEMIVENLSNSPLWVDNIGKTIVQVVTIESTLEQSLFSAKLVFSNKNTIFISNIGDNLMISSELSQEILDEEDAILTEL